MRKISAAFSLLLLFFVFSGNLFAYSPDLDTDEVKKLDMMKPRSGNRLIEEYKL